MQRVVSLWHFSCRIDRFSVVMFKVFLYFSLLMRRLTTILWMLSFSILPELMHAHVGGHPSVHDTVAAITLRMKSTFTEAELKALTPYQVEVVLELLEVACLLLAVLLPQKGGCSSSRSKKMRKQ